MNYTEYRGSIVIFVKFFNIVLKGSRLAGKITEICILRASTYLWPVSSPLPINYSLWGSLWGSARRRADIDSSPSVYDVAINTEEFGWARNSGRRSKTWVQGCSFIYSTEEETRQAEWQRKVEP